MPYWGAEQREIDDWLSLERLEHLARQARHLAGAQRLRVVSGNRVADANRPCEGTRSATLRTRVGDVAGPGRRPGVTDHQV
jgi:hypothetical protein